MPLSRYEHSLIVEHVSGLRPEALLSGQASLTPEQEQAVAALVARRLQERIPLQYLLGEAFFYGRRYIVNPSVLIPRPETELLCEAVLTWISRQPAQLHWQLVDVGTGSGCIATTLALALGEQGPSASITAVDISPEALALAQQNAHRLHANITFQQGDLLSGFPSQPYWDVIISNPPYIDPALAPTLEAEVLDHEPAMALFSGDQGFELVRRLGTQAQEQLKPGGLLAVEVGQGMAMVLAQEWQQQGWQGVTVLPDYAGIDRMVLAQKTMTGISR